MNMLVKATGTTTFFNYGMRKCGKMESYKTVLFVTYTDEDGNKHYTVNGRDVSKDSGNDTYKELKKFGTVKFDVTVIDENNVQEIIDSYMKGYDLYTQYIDDYKQCLEAEERNDNILRNVRVLKAAYNLK